MKSKVLKGVLVAAVAVIALIATSCSKNEPLKKDLLAQIAGTYKGTLTNSNGLKHDGTADVSAVNDSVVQIHCYDQEDFDTTFIMEIYANGDSVMLCNTGEDFVNQYGHEMTGAHHMWQAMSEHMNGGMSMDSNDWQQHMQTQHQPGDEHFGSFDMDNGTFNYRFGSDNSSSFGNFSGKKSS